MNLELNPDQKTLLEAIEKIAAPYSAAPTGDTSFFLDGMPLYRQMADGGFIEAASMEEYGPLAGVLALETASALPYSVPLAGACLIAPLALGASVDGPVAVMRRGGGRAVRHLPMARSLIVVGEDVRLLPLDGIAVSPLKSVFADPYGGIDDLAIERARALEGVSPDDVMCWWSVAVAAEIAGSGRAAIDRTVAFVKVRRQFGQPIGAYQAIQHRLAECEVLVHSTRMLARRAAVTREPAAAHLAAAYAESAAARIAYDTQQFHGASGITRENELHFFSYRLRALQGELTQTNVSAARAAELLWPARAGAEQPRRAADSLGAVA